MKIGICNDHAGVDYKNRLSEYLTGKGYEIVNFGTDSTERFNYPVSGEAVANAEQAGFNSEYFDKEKYEDFKGFTNY